MTPPVFGIDVWKPEFTHEVVWCVHNGSGCSPLVKFNDIHQLINKTTVMSFEIIQLFLTATSRDILSLGAGYDLGTVSIGLLPRAAVLKSSPSPRVNSFDCSLNRHEITVYYYVDDLLYCVVLV